MSAPVLPSHASPVPHVVGFWPVVLANVVLGAPAYFISFLFAYGFRDQVGLAEHLTFLVLITIFACVTGVVGAAFAAASRPGRPFADRVVPGVLMSAAMNAAAVGAGSVVSALHKAENSVSVDFSTTTDVLVAAGLFVTALVLGAAAVRTRTRRGA
jgi:hypothetical protein